MGSSTKTPNYELSQFGDTDKPTWRGDYNADMSALDTALHGLQTDKVDRVEADYYVADYGAVGDGTTDDTAHIVAACEAASAAGGGSVHLMRDRTHGWGGEIILKNGVLLVGGKGAHSGTPSMTALGPGAKLQIGNEPGINGAPEPVGWQPVGIENIRIDGNSVTGTGVALGVITNGLVEVNTPGANLNGLRVDDYHGPVLYLNNAQNCVYQTVEINNSDYGVVFDNGSQNNLFLRAEVSNCQNGVVFANTGTSSIYGPLENKFVNSIIENYVPGNLLIDSRCGSFNVFDNCSISNDQTTTLTSGKLVTVSNSDTPLYNMNGPITFRDCLFGTNSSAAAGSTEYGVVLHGSGAWVRFEGVNWFINTQACIVQDTGNGVCEVFGRINNAGVKAGPQVEAINSGTHNLWQSIIDGPIIVNVHSETNPNGIVVKKWNDTSVRIIIDDKGVISFYDGTSYSIQGVIGLLEDGVTLAITSPTGVQIQSPTVIQQLTTSIRHTDGGEHVIVPGAWDVIAVSGTWTPDFANNEVQRCILSGVGVNLNYINMQFSGSANAPAEGSVVTVMIYTDANTHNVVWSGDGVNGHGVIQGITTLPTALAANQVYSVTFIYDATNAAWYVKSTN